MTIPRPTVLVAAGVLLLGLLTSGVYEFQAYRAARGFNRALKQEDFARAAGHASVYGRLVGAYLAQRQGRWDEAVSLYTEAGSTPVPGLARTALYNRANLYLRRGWEARERGELDIAVPLIELAKHDYRELLAVASRHWDAKYNLERALQLLPDELEEVVSDSVMPQRSQEAAGAVPVFTELP